jgi:hypothetical protein
MKRMEAGYKFGVIVTVLLANDNMMTSTVRYIDNGNLTTEDKNGSNYSIRWLFELGRKYIWLKNER